MATKRQPSKQRRQTQNQKQRAALAARRAAASGAPPARATGGASPAGAPKGSVLSRLRGAPATGLAARAAAAGRSGSPSGLPPGHRAALSAVFAAVAAAVVGAFMLRLPVDRAGDPIVTPEARVVEWSLSAADAVEAAPDASPEEIAASISDWSPGGTKPYGSVYWPISLAAMLPVLGTGLGFRAVARRAPAKVVNRTMYVTLFGALLTAQLTLVFLPAVISLAIAAFQARKAEVVAAAAAPTVSDKDEIIDVDEAAEDEPTHDEAVDLEATADDADDAEAADETRRAT